MSADGLTRDRFLDGRLVLTQPVRGYRAGIDPVLLAASVPARPGDTVLDLGCGAGAALFCLGTRVPGLGLAGLERNPDYAALCRDNARDNRLSAEIVTGDLAAMPAGLKARSFAHVIANPPYFDRTRGTAAPEPLREAALGDSVPLETWVRQAARRAAPGGTVTFIQRPERLPELVAAMRTCLGSLALLPVVPRAGRPARLILLRGRKGGRAAFRCHDSWVLHSGGHHLRDGDDYTTETSLILREGAALPF